MELLLATARTNAPSAKRILEVGCGTGLLAQRLAQLFPDALVEAIDISPQMIARASEWHSLPHLTFAQEDFWTLHRESYDLVVSVNTWYFFPLEKSIEHLDSLLSPLGQILLVTYGRSIWSVPHAFAVSRLTGTKTYLHSPEALTTLLSARGFRAGWSPVNRWEGTYLVTASRALPLS